MTAPTEASSVHLNLDHVVVECRNGGAVVVRCYDAETDTVSVWVMTHIDGGWNLQAATIGAECPSFALH